MNILRKNKLKQLTLLNFKTFYVIPIKTVWYWEQKQINRSMKQTKESGGRFIHIMVALFCQNYRERKAYSINDVGTTKKKMNYTMLHIKVKVDSEF